MDKKKFSKEMEKQRKAIKKDVDKRYPGVKSNTDAIHNFARWLRKRK